MSFNDNHSSQVSNSTSSGISFSGLLTIVFVVLKLCHVIDWSWFWVLFPLWGSIAVVMFIWLVVILVAVLFGWFKI